MSKVKLFFAVCACLVSAGVRDAEAQSVSLNGSTLTVQGGGSAEAIEVLPSTNLDGYIVRINGRVTAGGGQAFFPAIE